eukprot:TRINITY_DN59621_c0_g1_i1.p1 TRINITY_DN59621_c0_g1~~TRINITY_DN59621_c0_g1_i1.p1  ORF type:complete len:151 (+),score=20.28 TRINITY_DN59621_c0_g1_i1:126-578(+)
MSRRDWPDVNHLVSVKVDGVSCTQEEVIGVKEELREKFGKYGEVGDVYIPRSGNFAFVRFVEKRDAEEAVDRMDGKEFMGHDIRCSLSEQKKKAAEEYPDRGRGGRGGRNRRSRSRRRRDDSQSDSRSRRGRGRRRDDSSSRSRDRRRRR